jgi:hypothetical protein
MPSIKDHAVISKVNSTSTQLAGDGTFTGLAEVCEEYSTITVYAYSDVDSATNGFVIEFSMDGTNFDRAKTVSFTGGLSQAHAFAVISKYYRVRYTNGTAATSDFRIQAIMHVAKPRDITSGTEQVIQKYDDVTLFRPVTDVTFDRNVGRIGYESTSIFSGTNTGISTSFEDVWTYGGTAAFYWAQTAAAVRIQAGGNAADDAAGAGARSILVVGLDENWAEATEVITTAGTSASSYTTTTFIRVNTIVVLTTGTYGGTNTGAILLEDASANIWAHILAGSGRSQMAKLSVPAGKTYYLTSVIIEISTGNSGEFRTFVRKNGDDVTTPFSPEILGQRLVDFEGAINFKLDTYTVLPEKTDFHGECKKVSGGGTASITFIAQYIAVDN